MLWKNNTKTFEELEAEYAEVKKAADQKQKEADLLDKVAAEKKRLSELNYKGSIREKTVNFFGDVNKVITKIQPKEKSKVKKKTKKEENPLDFRFE